MKASKTYAAPSLTKAIDVVHLLSKHSGWVPFGVIWRTLNLPKSSTYVILNSLLQNGIVYCDSKRRGYKLGFKLLTIGQQALFQSTEKLIGEAQKAVSQVSREYDVSSFFGYINENNEAVYAARATPPCEELDVKLLGTPIPPQTSAIGKALLAWRDEKSVRTLITQTAPKDHTDRAILDPSEFIKHLKKIRCYGFSVNNREASNGCVCVAAPVFSRGRDAPIGGISIVSSYEKMNSGLFEKASECIYGTAKELSKQFGATIYPEYTFAPYSTY